MVRSTPCQVCARSVGLAIEDSEIRGPMDGVVPRREHHAFPEWISEGFLAGMIGEGGMCMSYSVCERIVLDELARTFRMKIV